MGSRIIDAAYPLYVIAFLMGHEDEEMRHLGVSILMEMASECAEYVAYMNHLQTCQKCADRTRMVRAVFIALLEEE